MRMTNCARATAEAFVDEKLAEIARELRAGGKPIELGKAPTLHIDKRFLVN